MDNYVYIRISKDNIKDLQYLYKHSFGIEVKEDFLLKKYDTSAFGLSYVGYIAYNEINNQPAAYYGVFPVTCSYNNQTFLAAQSGDTMTHPEHRGRGLFIKLAQMTYALAKLLNVSFIFGFPNDNSYPGFIKKLGWSHYSNINNYKIPTGSIPLDKIAKKYDFLRPLYEKLILKKLTKNPEVIFQNSIENQLKDSGYVIHNEVYFLYKKYSGSFIIKINNTKCWIKIDGRLWVGDIEYCNEIEFNLIIDKLIILAKNHYCSSVCFSFFEGSKYNSWIEKRYSVNSKNPVGCLALNNIVVPEKFAYQAIDFDTF